MKKEEKEKLIIHREKRFFDIFFLSFIVYQEVTPIQVHWILSAPSKSPQPCQLQFKYLDPRWSFEGP